MRATKTFAIMEGLLKKLAGALGLHKKLAIALLVVSGADGVLTVWATNHGFIEVNPLMAPIANTWILPVWKVGIAALGAAFVLLFSLRFPRVVTFGLAAAVTFVLSIFVLDLLELT